MAIKADHGSLGATTAACVLPIHQFAVVSGPHDLMLCPQVDRKAGHAIVSSYMQKKRQQHHVKEPMRKSKASCCKLAFCSGLRGSVQAITGQIDVPCPQH